MKRTMLFLLVATCAVAANVIFTDDFPGAALPKSWKATKGRWEVANGVVKGVELAEDKHAAVIRRNVSFTNGVVEFEFQLAGAQSLHLSINDAKGHVCRAILTPEGMKIQKDTPGEVLGEWKKPIRPNQWHTLRVEFHGKGMKATLDGKATIEGSHERMDTLKTSVGFPVKGDAALLRHVRVTGE